MLIACNAHRVYFGHDPTLRARSASAPQSTAGLISNLAATDAANALWLVAFSSCVVPLQTEASFCDKCSSGSTFPCLYLQTPAPRCQILIDDGNRSSNFIRTRDVMASVTSRSGRPSSFQPDKSPSFCKLSTRALEVLTSCLENQSTL